MELRAQRGRCCGAGAQCRRSGADRHHHRADLGRHDEGHRHLDQRRQRRGGDHRRCDRFGHRGSGVANGTAGTSPATGDLDATDVDSATDFSVVTNGVHGTLSINAAGEWSYALNEDDAAVQALNVGDPALTDTITVQTSDGTTKDITITINGANDAAVITGDDRSVTEPPASERHGRHLAGDRRPRRDRCRQRRRLLGRDQRRARHAEHQCGRRVELRAQRGRCAVQALNVGDPALTDTITVQTSDGTTKDIVISINGANDAAVITGDATGSVTEASGVANGTAGTSPATGDLDATDVDSAPTSRW
ncbi:hypothetical protein EJ071_27175 [Mesorhizobium sp. M1B.F.Ca.ET.045.04.1.1]|nr:hypothetical protein EJ071_27175 [Mesorhizobium sp. M1B.F.Ca.ET.045.04.1.1]